MTESRSFFCATCSGKDGVGDGLFSCRNGGCVSTSVGCSAPRASKNEDSDGKLVAQCQGFAPTGLPWRVEATGVQHVLLQNKYETLEPPACQAVHTRGNDPGRSAPDRIAAASASPRDAVFQFPPSPLSCTGDPSSLPSLPEEQGLQHPEGTFRHGVCPSQ